MMRRHVDRPGEAADRRRAELGRPSGGLRTLSGIFTKGLAGVSVRRILFDALHVEIDATVPHRRREDIGHESGAGRLG